MLFPVDGAITALSFQALVHKIFLKTREIDWSFMVW